MGTHIYVPQCLPQCLPSLGYFVERGLDLLKIDQFLYEPILHLLHVKHRKRLEKLPDSWTVLLYFGLPLLALTLWTCRYGDECYGCPGGRLYPILLAMLTLGLLLSICLPLWASVTSATVASGFRRGRCIDEMISAGILPSQIVDSLALGSLSLISRLSLSVWLMVASLLYFLKVDLGDWKLLWWIWPLVVPVATIVFSYLAVGIVLIGSSLNFRTLQFLVAFLPAILELPIAYRHDWTPNQTVVGFASLVLMGTLLTRDVAFDALWHGGDMSSKYSPRSSLLQDRLRMAWGDNPILFRELARQASSRSGLFGCLYPALIHTLPPILWGNWMWSNLHLASERFFPGLVGVGLLQMLAAALLTLDSVTRERQQKTWDTVVESGVALEDFQAGWMQFALLSDIFYRLPILLVILVSMDVARCALSLPVSIPGYAVLVAGSAAFIAVMSSLGACLGLGLSASSSDLQAAGRRLIGALLVLLALSGLSWLFVVKSLMFLIHFEKRRLAYWLALPISFLFVYATARVWCKDELVTSLSARAQTCDQSSALFRTFLVGATTAILIHISGWERTMRFGEYGVIAMIFIGLCGVLLFLSHLLASRKWMLPFGWLSVGVVWLVMGNTMIYYLEMQSIPCREVQLAVCLLIVSVWTVFEQLLIPILLPPDSLKTGHC